MSNLTQDFSTSIEKVLKEIPKEGYEGKFPCPVCHVGVIHWLRVRSNKHLRIGCTQPGCVMLMS